MAQFEGVSVVRKANIYFDGKVTSRTILFPDGSKKTLGIMLPGEYTFSTEAAELMEIHAGDLDVRLPDSPEWRTVGAEQAFEVPAHASFDLRVRAVTDYCCSFIA